MAAGKLTNFAMYSTLSGKMVGTIRFNKRNQELKGRKHPVLTKYDAESKKHVSTADGTLKLKEIKKAS